MEDNNVEQKAIDWLKGEVTKYCNANGMIELYWDYQDREALEDTLSDYLEDYDGGNLTEFIADSLREKDWYYDWCYEGEDSLIEDIKKDVDGIEDEEVKQFLLNQLEDFNDFKELLYSAGYDGVDDGIEEELKNLQINVNLTLATDEEANQDMSSIIVAFGTDYLPVSFDGLGIENLDNAVTYLIHQQGHTLKEFYDCLLGNKDGGKFLNSLVREMENNPAEATSGLTVLVSVGTDEYSALVSKEGNIEVSTDTEIGLYNSWIGGGSLFEIELEKPFVFPASMIMHADFDNVTGTGYYSVGDTYGTMNDSRKGNVTLGGEASAVSEDLDEVIEYVRTTYGNEEIEESKEVKAESKEDLDMNSKTIYKKVQVTFECDDCGHKEDWTFDDMAEWRLAFLEASDSNEEVGDCPECGSIYYNMKDYKIIEE